MGSLSNGPRSPYLSYLILSGTRDTCYCDVGLASGSGLQAACGPSTDSAGGQSSTVQNSNCLGPSASPWPHVSTLSETCT